MKKILFKGSATALVTPFKEDGSINFAMLSKLIKFQIKSGTQALVILGTTGESPTITREERTKIISHVVSDVAGKIPVIVGTGSNCTAVSIDLTQEAESLGANGALIVTPFYNKTSQMGIIKHYSAIASKTNLPLILYNVPSRTGLNIKPQTYKELSQIENIVATKEANGDISSVIETKHLCGDSLNIYSGNDDQTLPMIAVGALGVISVFSNIMPYESQQIASNSNSAKNLLLKYCDLMNALFCDVNPIPIKYALKSLGMDCGSCRLPLCDLSENSKKFIDNIIKKHDLNI